MARKNKSRLSKKEKRKSVRQTRKTIRKTKFVGSKKLSLALAGYNNKINNDKMNNKKDSNNAQSGLSQRNENINSAIQEQLKNDDIPTTSRRMVACRNSPNKKFRRSPLQSGSVKKFQKFRDDQARKLLKRSRLMMNDKHKSQNGRGNQSYAKTNVQKTAKPSKENNITMNSYRNYQKRKEEQKNNLGTTEHSHKYNAKKRAATSADSDSDDDCVIVEQCPSHVTILDDDDNDDDSDDSSDSSNDCHEQSIMTPANSSYQLFSQSFSRRLSSTPCGKSSNAVTYPNVAYPQHYNAPSFADVARNQFFIDVASNAYLGKVVAYNTLAPLVGNNRELNAKDNNSVVDLDDVSRNASHNTTLKNETNEIETSSSEDDSSSEESEEGVVEDDSVVFVSATNSNDFIPINSKTEVNQNKPKTTDAPGTGAQTVQHYSNLLNINEKRQLQEYNSNTYNPNAGKVLTSKLRMVIIDGSNVAFKHAADQQFSVKGLTIAIEYFEKKGHEVKAVIPQYRMNQNKSSDPNELHRLHKAGNIVQTPCKNLPGLTSTSYDDRFILQLASELDAAIVSNDNYRDLMHENAAFKKIIETRVIGYTWCNDMFLLPKDPYGKWGPTLDMILYRS